MRCGRCSRDTMQHMREYVLYMSFDAHRVSPCLSSLKVLLLTLRAALAHLDFNPDRLRDIDEARWRV